MSLRTVPAEGWLSWLRRHREWFWIAAILLVIAVGHAVNMFDYPYYEDDEGTYVAQAWAVLQGHLAPYTYWYDHAPAGWIQIAAWAVLTGGFHAFGTAVESSRVLMLGFHMGSTLLLYSIARRLSGSMLAAGLACALFGLSAYGIQFQRRVLLDNVATFWMLLSIWLLVGRRLSLTRVWMSAVALAVSILSKELTIFLVPAMAALVWLRAARPVRAFAVSGWVVLVGLVFSLYLLMALLNGELFPTGTLLGGNSDHVSLLGTLQYQASRGKDPGVLDFGSGFWQLVLRSWVREEPMLVLGGTVSALLALTFIRRRPAAGIMGLLTFSLWAFLARGGEVIGFYLVPLLPLLALNLALLVAAVCQALVGTLRRWQAMPARALRQVVAPVMTAVFAMGLLGGYMVGLLDDPLRAWLREPAVGQREAIDWIRASLPPGSPSVIDMYMWLDVRPEQDDAQYYWKVEEDPAIREGIFSSDWQTVDYVITTPQLLADANAQAMPLMHAALDHSTIVARFDTGWPVEVHQVAHEQAAAAADHGPGSTIS